MRWCKSATVLVTGCHPIISSACKKEGVPVVASITSSRNVLKRLNFRGHTLSRLLSELVPGRAYASDFPDLGYFDKAAA